jgi:GTP cyclohydrolase I
MKSQGAIQHLNSILGTTVELLMLDNGSSDTLYGTLHAFETGFAVIVTDSQRNTQVGSLVCFGREDILEITAPGSMIEGLATITIRPRKEQTKRVDGDKVQSLVYELLSALGEDPAREGLADTPRRVAKFWSEFLDHNEPNLGTVFESVNVDEMVIVKDIADWSLCEHHLLPFRFVAHVCYITGDKVIGLSKIPRIVRHAARRLQLQERLTNDVADAIEKIVKPKGVGVVIQGWHTCMQMRGIHAREGSMVTSCMRGVLLGNPVARSEFMDLIK